MIWITISVIAALGNADSWNSNSEQINKRNCLHYWDFDTFRCHTENDNTVLDLINITYIVRSLLS